MESTLKPKPTDDPHDFLVVTPDGGLVASADQARSSLAPDAVRPPSDPQTPVGSPIPMGSQIPMGSPIPVGSPTPMGSQAQTASEFSAGPRVPPVDATFRPAVVNDIPVPGNLPLHRRSIGGPAVRAFIALLLAACIGLAAIAWQSYGDAARRIIATWAPQLLLTSSQPVEKTGLPAQSTPPAVEAAAANAPAPQSAPPAQTAAQAVAPAAQSPESAQLLQSMARDLATVGQQIEQIKASIEQLKAGQQQMSREVAKVSEAKASDLRPRIPAPPPRTVARTRRPIPPYPYPPAQAAAAPGLPQSTAPYVPRQPDYVPRQPESQSQATDQPQADPESSSIPRPPMPLR